MSTRQAGTTDWTLAGSLLEIVATRSAWLKRIASARGAAIRDIVPPDSSVFLVLARWLLTSIDSMAIISKGVPG